MKADLVSTIQARERQLRDMKQAAQQLEEKLNELRNRI